VVVVEEMVESDQQEQVFFEIFFSFIIHFLEEGYHNKLKHPKRNKACNGLNVVLLFTQQIDDLTHFIVGEFS
jgi:hypothetical protein